VTEPQPSDLAEQLRLTEDSLRAMSTRMTTLARLDRDARVRVMRTCFVVALAVGTIVALGLPFLWDRSGHYSATSSVSGWRLLTYDKLLAYDESVPLFPRLLPWAVILAAAFTAYALQPVLALIAALIDVGLIVGCVIGASQVSVTGRRLGSDVENAISGPGSGWWVAILLLAGWTALASDIWARRHTDPYPIAAATGR
jgi:hypothetical protein